MPTLIRPITQNELPLLAAVHQSSIRAFEQIPELARECKLPPLPPELLERFEVLVAIDRPSRPDDTSIDKTSITSDHQEMVVGFVAVRCLDRAKFIAMICVAQECQGKGVGTALLDRVIAETKAQGGGTLSLTTFRDVPWNGKWYQRMGFREMSDQEVEHELGSEHLDMLERSREKHERPGSQWRWIVMSQRL